MTIKTKQDYLLQIDFEYLIRFSSETKIYRNYRKYFTKKDFVNALLRSLNHTQCNGLYTAYLEGISPEKIAQSFLHKYPTYDIIRDRLVEDIGKNRDENEVIFFEFPVLNTRTDVTRIDGKSFNYEIKTGRDNILRLQNQLNTFTTLFERNYVVCPMSSYETANDHISHSVGIIVYEIFEDGIKFKEKIPARKSLSLDSTNQLKVLTLQGLRKMYEKRIGHHQSLDRFQLTNKILSRYTDKEINQEFKNYLKNKYSLTTNKLITEFT